MKPYRKKMQIVFQDPYSSLDPRMMVSEIILEGMGTHRVLKNRKERLERIHEIMNLVGLDGSMLDRYPHEFSGGQRQRVGIARALAVESEILILDEATSALDVSVQAQILNLLRSLQQKLSLSYIFITHNLSVVEYIADRVAVMYLGRIVEEGPAEDIFKNPAHPYTRALLAAAPMIEEKQLATTPVRISADVASAVNPPAGCHFHPRCAERKDECAQVFPEKSALGNGHDVRCHLY